MHHDKYIIEIVCGEDEIANDLLRANLKAALLATLEAPAWREIYPGLSKLPKYVKKVSGTALVINEKIAWRLHSSISVPTTGEISIMIKRAKTKRIQWKRILQNHFSFLVALVIALFPKCPFCWAAYMSLFSAFGLSSFSYKPWLLPFFVVLLFINIISLYKSRKRHGYSPLLLALTGALLITLNRYYWNNMQILFTGSFMLITASLWNSLPRRMIASLKYYFKSTPLRRLPAPSTSAKRKSFGP